MAVFFLTLLLRAIGLLFAAITVMVVLSGTNLAILGVLFGLVSLWFLLAEVQEVR